MDAIILKCLLRGLLVYSVLSIIVPQYDVSNVSYPLGGISGTGSVGIVSRPSALKSTSGHQRAFSQGQITDGPNSGSLSRSGHSRVGSRTDFILPPGHKEGGGNQPGSAGSLFKPGHKRQASRSESIYTLRQGIKPNLFTRCFNFLLGRKLEADPMDNRQRIIVPNHMVPAGTRKREHPNGRWANNYVCTTKYTMLSFIPKNLFEQVIIETAFLYIKSSQFKFCSNTLL